MKKYHDYRNTINSKYKASVLEVKFEDFVENFDKEQRKILKFIGGKKISNKFNVDKSKYNAFKAKVQLSGFEKNFIQKKLKKYLQW